MGVDRPGRNMRERLVGEGDRLRTKARNVGRESTRQSTCAYEVGERRAVPTSLCGLVCV